MKNLLLLTALLSTTAFAQVSEGICELEIQPTVFKTISTVVPYDNYPNERIQIIPAKFKTITNRVVIAQEHFEGDELTTEEIEVVIAQATKSYEVIPAVYGTVTETVVVSPGYTEYKLLTDEDLEELEANGEKTRNRLFKKVVPAYTKEITKRVMTSAASVKEILIPARTRTITKTIVKRAAAPSDRGAKISAKTIMVNTIVQHAPAQIRRVALPVPAVLRTVQRRVVDTPAAILCK